MNSTELLLRQRKSYAEGTEMVLRGIKAEWFNTKPLPELMTFGEQIDHIAAVEADTLDETATALQFDKIPFNYTPSENLEFSIAQWIRIHDLGDRFIANLDDKSLDFRFLTVSHMQVSVHSMLISVIEHEIQHRGEISAYFRMMDANPTEK